MISLAEDNKMLGYELLSAFPNISHFVTTRQGGYSKGMYATFNCSPFSGDDESDVLHNQQLLCSTLPQKPDRLIIPRQVHGTEIAVIDHRFACLTVPEQEQVLSGMDAVVSNLPGYAVCVSTADCVPILLYDKKNKVVAAVHAGWRGTVEKILSRTIDLMYRRFNTSGNDLYACIGPSISPDAFEVGDEVHEAFLQKGFDMQRIAFRKEETEKYHIDLWQANRSQLEEYGVPARQIECAGICTYKEHERFFSARRLGILSGRILSGIMINT